MQSYKKRYFSARDLSVIAVFSAMQFVLQYFAGRITFIPGAERPIVAFPVAFMAAITYLRVQKIGAIGITTLVTGILMLFMSGFPPVIFEWIGATIGAEAVVIVGHGLKGRCGALCLSLAGGFLMLGRGIGVTVGLFIFLPVAVLHNVATLALLYTYIAFNGPVPFVLGTIGAYAAIQAYGRWFGGGVSK